jgi:hypothetical protein
LRQTQVCRANSLFRWLAPDPPRSALNLFQYSARWKCWKCCIRHYRSPLPRLSNTTCFSDPTRQHSVNFSGDVGGEPRNGTYSGLGAGGDDGGCPFVGDGGAIGAPADGDLHLADCTGCRCRLEVFYRGEVLTPWPNLAPSNAPSCWARLPGGVGGEQRH